MEVTDINLYKPHKGFTLLELLMTLAIAAVVLLVAVPSFMDLIYSARRTAAINTFVSYIHLARNEAITRGTDAIFCLSKDQQNCVSGDDLLWDSGIIFSDIDGDRKRDEDEPLLHVFSAPAGIDIYASSTVRRKLRFMPDGSALGSTTTVRFCDPQRTRVARAVILSNAGRPRVSDLSETAYTCPEKV